MVSEAKWGEEGEKGEGMGKYRPITGKESPFHI
jgi:hypothetical protein